MGRKNPDEWSRPYRLSIMDDSTHVRIRSYRFTKTIAVIIAVTAVVTVSILFWCLLALTPLRTTIPGYPDANSKREAVVNAIKIDSLESSITRWELYAENLSRVLDGKETLELDSIIKGNSTRYLQAKSLEALQKQDSIMRETVRAEEQFGVSGEGERRLPITGMHFFPPIKGVVSQGFDKILHPGLDLTAPANSVVYAVLDGTVIFAGWSEETGYTMLIQHDADIISTYSHNQKLLLKPGDKVTAGTPVAIVGNTGSTSYGDHLHFELWYKGEAQDPAKYISF